MSYKNKFFAIASHCSLKRLEEPYLYDIENDELYELGEEAYQFLLKCSQGERVSVRKEDEEFVEYCLSENLITLSETPVKRKNSPSFTHSLPSVSGISDYRSLRSPLPPLLRWGRLPSRSSF